MPVSISASLPASQSEHSRKCVSYMKNPLASKFGSFVVPTIISCGIGLIYSISITRSQQSQMGRQQAACWYCRGIKIGVNTSETSTDASVRRREREWRRWGGGLSIENVWFFCQKKCRWFPEWQFIMWSSFLSNVCHLKVVAWA